jgi:hypothetical protein
VRIDIYGPSHCNYFVAKAAAKSIDNVISLFFGQPKEIRTYGNNTFCNAIKSHFQHKAIWSSIDREPGDAEIFWYAKRMQYNHLPLVDNVPALALVRDRVVETYGISSAKFCEVYGWQVGDVLECTDEPIVLKVETIDQSTGTVYGGRCNEFQQDFGAVQEIFPDFRFRKVEL